MHSLDMALMVKGQNERYLAAQDLIWEYLGTTNITRATIDTTQKEKMKFDHL